MEENKRLNLLLLAGSLIIIIIVFVIIALDVKATTTPEMFESTSSTSTDEQKDDVKEFDNEKQENGGEMGLLGGVPDGYNGYCKKITSDPNKVAVSYSYGIIFDLSLAGDHFWANVADDGGNIRMYMSDLETELPRGVREFDKNNKKGLVYFLATNISASVSTDYYICYGDSSLSDYADDHAKGMENVFSSSYKFYSTMADLTSSTIKDETSNDNNGTKKGDDEPIEANGKVGKAQDFDGTDDNVLVIDNVGLRLTTAGTIFLWFNLDAISNDNYPKFVSKRDGDSAAGTDYSFGMKKEGTGNPIIYANLSDGTSSATLNGTTIISTGSWIHTAFVWGGTDWEIYYNGSEDNSGTGAITVQQTTKDLRIGSRRASDTLGSYFNGKINDVAVLNSALTANEILTIYNNQSDNTTFWSIEDDPLPMNLFEHTDAIYFYFTTFFYACLFVILLHIFYRIAFRKI